MPRRRYRGYSRRSYSHDRPYEYDDYYAARRSGCVGSIRHFFRNLAITILVIVSAIILVLLIVLIVTHLALAAQILLYVLYVAGGFAVLGMIYGVVRIIAAMSHAISSASAARADARLKQEHWRQAQMQVRRSDVEVQQQRVKLAQEHHGFQQQRLRDLSTARLTQVIEDYQQREPGHQPVLLPGSVPPEPETKASQGIPGMPKKGQVFHYRDYVRLLHRGELIAGIKADRTAHIASWDDFKILLVLGSSSSGKTTTIVEKCLCAVRSGGQLVICDPHAQKPDSLTRRIVSLQSALMPGTVLAQEHQEIMTNLRTVRAEFERRRRGANISTPIYVVVEEVNRLMRDKAIAKELTNFCEEMGQEARGYNIYLILCAQRVSGLADIRNSMIACICHKVSPMESEKCLPARFAKYTAELGVGQSFVLDADGNVFALQQVLVTREDVEALRQRLASACPPAPTYPATTPIVRPVPPAPSQQLVLRPAQLARQPAAPYSARPASSPASATWGDPPPASRQATTTWSQVPEPRHITQAMPHAHDPFSALAALRDQQRQKRK